MKFIALLAVLLVCVSNSYSAGSSGDVFIIDSFDVYSEVLLIVTTAQTTYPAQDQTFAQDPSIFSGERDAILIVTASPTGMVFSSSVDSGQYSSSAPTDGTAFSYLQYDGVDGSATLNPSGAFGDSNNDFTQNSATSIHLVITNDIATTVDVFVYSGSQDSYCQVSFAIPSDSNSADFIAKYTSFSTVGSGCSFDNVGAVEIVTDLPPNVDIFIEVFATYGTIATTPTPAASPSKLPSSSNAASASRTPSKIPSASRVPSATRTPSKISNCDCVCKAFHCVLEYDPSGVNTVYYETSALNPSNGSGAGSTASSNGNNGHHGSSSNASILAVSFALIVAAVALL